MRTALPVVGESDFDTVVLASPVPVLVDYFTTWCGPCKALAPTLERLAEEYGEAVRVVSVDAELSPELARRYDVLGFPTVILFKEGAEIERPQDRSRLQLKAVLDRALGVAREDAAAEAVPVPAAATNGISPKLRALLDELARLEAADWERVSAWAVDDMKRSTSEPADPSDTGATVNEEELSVALSRLSDDVEELAAARGSAGPLAQIIASAAAASFSEWVRPTTRPGWFGALRAVPAARMSPYLPEGDAPSDPGEAASGFLAELRSLSAAEWDAVRVVNHDYFPWATYSSSAGLNAYLCGAILVQAVLSAELISRDRYEASWAPFMGVVDRTGVEQKEEKS